MNKTRRYRIYFWAILSIFFIALYGSILLFRDRVFSYDTNVAHPNIIAEAVFFYNKNSSNKLNLQQINWMEQGTIDEDKPTRWYNHFYDPINNSGYSGYSTAKNWAKDLDRQRNFALGDHTWQNALDNYQKGNYEQAFTDLGHVLHLIADMSVPAHTRDDSHPFGDSYEQYIKNNWYSVKNNLNLNLNFGDYKIDSLEKAFDNSAYYSNGNFYSDDTIFTEKYKSPYLKNAKKGDKYYNLGNIKLIYYEESSFNNAPSMYFMDNSVLDSYSQHLLPKAIGYSAGVIDLFFREVAKNEKHRVVENKTSWLGYLNHAVGSIITGAKNLWDFGGDVKDTLVDSFGSVVDSVRSESAPSLSSQTNLPVVSSGDQVSEQNGLVVPQLQSQLVITEPVEYIEPTNNETMKQLNNETIILPVNNTQPDNPPDWYNELQQKSQSQIISNPVIKPELEEDIFIAPIVYSGGGGSSNHINTETQEQTNIDNQINTSTSQQSNTSTIEQLNDEIIETTSTIPIDNNNTTSTNNNEVIEPLNNAIATSSEYIKLNEILSNANIGDNEWIELYNYSTTTVNIDGWSICDSTLNNCKTISNTLITTTTIKGESWFVFDLQTSRYLNNTGDSVILFNAVNQEMDRIIYGNVLGTPDKNQSLARRNDGYDTDSNSNWAITNIITKGTANIINEDDTTPPAVPTIKTTVSSTKIIVDLESQDDSDDSVLYDLQNSNDNSNWQDVATSTTDNQFTVDGILGKTYYFRARGTDSSGNTSPWSDYNGNPIVVLFDLSREVVINEIAWAGTSIDYQDRQWIELYNNTSSSIDLSSWKVIIDGEELTITSRPSSTVQAYNYYLLERYDDKTIRDIDADLIYHDPKMSKTGSILQLINNNGQYVDQVNCQGGWFAGGGNKYASMKRLDTTISGNDKNNWSSSIGIRSKGRDYSTEYVYGSPRQTNQGFLALYGRQEDDEVVLDPQNNPYFLSNYEIPAGKKLIIKPGVVIKSYVKGANMIVYGELVSEGDENNRIIFTSSRDNNFNTTTLKIDLANWGGEPQVGDWQGIWFKSGSVGNLSYTDLRYGGYSFYTNLNLPPHSQVIRAENSQLNLDNVSLDGSNQDLIYLDNCSTTISHSSLSNAKIAVKADDGQLSMDDIKIINITDGNGSVQVDGFWPSLSNFDFASTTNQTIGFEDIEFKNQTVTLGPNMDFKFKSLMVDASSTLNIQSGTTLNLPTYAFIHIYGKLNSNGTAQNPINIGVDKGWGYMYLENAQATLSYTNFYGGGGLSTQKDGNKYNKWYSGSYKDYMIELVDSDFDCRNCRFWDYRAPGHGIKSYNSSIALVSSEIGMDNKWSDEKTTYTTGIKADGGSIFLDNVNFVNLNYGIFTTGQTTGNQPTVIMQNMTPSNWVNVYKSWVH